ASSYPSSYR
ncbi:hypothetical protein AB1N83_014079, partial [Pleurotus pulmonarius]